MTDIERIVQAIGELVQSTPDNLVYYQPAVRAVLDNSQKMAEILQETDPALIDPRGLRRKIIDSIGYGYWANRELPNPVDGATALIAEAMLRILIHEVASGNQGRALPEQNGLVFDREHQRVWIDGIPEELNDRQAEMFSVLWEAKGEWKTGAVIGEGAAKVKLSMPARLRAEIESHKRQGYRIRRFLPKLTP